MRFGRASVALGLLAVVGLCVAGTASSAGTQRVTARTTFVAGSTTCTPPAPKAQNLTVEHCTGGVETWTGDITGTGRYSFDRITNLSSGTAVLYETASKSSKAPVFSVPAEVTCTRNGTSTTSVRVLSSSSRASTVEPGHSLALMDRFESSTSTSANTRASSASRYRFGHHHERPARRAFLLSRRAASLGRGAAWARWPSGSSKLVRSCNPRLGRFDSGAAPSDSRYLQSLEPRSSEKGLALPPTVTGVFHGKQPSFCAVAATRRMSANTTPIASAIKNFLMP